MRMRVAMRAACENWAALPHSPGRGLLSPLFPARLGTDKAGRRVTARRPHSTPLWEGSNVSSLFGKAPLVERYRPATWAEVVGQERVVGRIRQLAQHATQRLQ